MKQHDPKAARHHLTPPKDSSSLPSLFQYPQSFISVDRCLWTGSCFEIDVLEEPENVMLVDILLLMDTLILL